MSDPALRQSVVSATTPQKQAKQILSNKKRYSFRKDTHTFLPAFRLRRTPPSNPPINNSDLPNQEDKLKGFLHTSFQLLKK
jgi:hypothetical protein